MKVVAISICLNEEDYLGYALKSIYNLVDKIIIVEGADRASRKLATKKGLSIDATGGIIKNFPDKQSKIKYIQYGLCNDKNDLRQCSLENVDKDTDYVLVIDGDLLYRKEEIENVFKLCEEHPALRTVFVEHLMFFHDFHHILDIDEKFKRGFRYYSPEFFWKYNPALHYVHQHIHLDGKIYWQKQPGVVEAKLSELSLCKTKDIILVEPQFALYHFGWVRMKHRLDRHILQWFKMNIMAAERRQKRGIKEKPSAPKSEAALWVSLIGKTDGEILGWIHHNHKLYTEVYDEKIGEHVREYTGKYPEEIKTHPWWNFTKKDFGL